MSDSNYSSQAAGAADKLRATLPGRLAANASATPNRIALREKHMGIWREVTWQAYLDHVREFASALHGSGFTAGDRIAILSDNRPEWLFADLGAQALGGIATGIYQTNPPNEVAYIIEHSGSRLIVCEDQEQVDKVLEIQQPLPHLEWIVVIDPRGTQAYGDSRLVTWDTFISNQDKPAISEAEFTTRLKALDPHAACMIIYTSGTTGAPKGALISHHNVLPLSDQAIPILGVNDHDSVLSYLPLCHVAEKIFSVFLPLSAGCTVHFGESIETIQQDLGEVSPSVFLGVPRIWEKLHAGVTVRMNDASRLKRSLYHWALATGRQVSEKRLGGKSLGIGDRIKQFCADRLVLAALRERLGLGRCRLPASGAAPVAPELLGWFHAIGVPINEGYGLTETSGIAAINLPGEQRLGSVGRPTPGAEIAIADDGEVLVRGANVFLGYLNNAEATAESIDADRWLHTGDLGRIDDAGFVYITGRKKEIIITAGGKNLSPQHIENSLKTSPYIKEAAAVGDAKPFITALIQIEGDVVGNWALRNRIPYTSFEDLSANPAVVELIGNEIDRINQSMPRVEQVRKFRLLPKELHQDDGEVTATQKLRRKVVYEKFTSLIDEMYLEKKAEVTS